MTPFESVHPAFFCATVALPLSFSALGGSRAPRRLSYLGREGSSRRQPAQLIAIRIASLSQPLEDKPRGFLRDSNFIGKLHGGDPLPGGDEQIHRVEPFVEGDMRPLKIVPVRTVKSNLQALQR